MSNVKQSYRQAITTKYAGPTNSRGSRIMVRAQAGRMTVPWDHALDAAENHARAVRLFCERMASAHGVAAWTECEWIGGALPDGSGYCFVELWR